MSMGTTTLLAMGGGGLSGLAVLAALAGSPLGLVLVYLAPLPLLLVGLGLGIGAFGFAAGAGIAVALVFGGFAGAGLYGGMHVIPSWLIVQQALRPRAASADGWQPIGQVLVTVTLLIAFVVVATSVAGRGEGSIEENVRELLASVAQMAAPALDDAQRSTVVEQLAPLFLGFSAITWLLMLVVNGLMAQSLLAARGWNRRPLPTWSDLRLPQWFDWVLVGAAVVALATGGDVSFIARNTVIILLMPYFFVGLAVAHQLARQTPAPALALTAFYMILLVFFLFAAALVAALGVAEQWFGVRRRAPGPPQENE